MNLERRQHLLESRFQRPQAIDDAAAARELHDPLSGDERVLIVAADHAARGALDVGANPSAMSDRYDMLDRLVTALAITGVSGVLGTPDVIEDLLLLGALERKLVFGSMNRGGLPARSSRWTIASPPIAPNPLSVRDLTAKRCCCVSTSTTPGPPTLSNRARTR